MYLTRGRAKEKLWAAARVSCVLAAFVLAWPAESRADPLEWLKDLLQEDVENVSLSGVDLPPDAIVTGRDETRTIKLGHDLIELYPATAITFEMSGKKTTVHLLGGTIRAKVSKRKNNQTFEVETPTLVGIVKGTEFEVSAIGGASAVSVYEGRVAVKAAGRIGGLDVTPGKTATVTDADREPSLGKTPAGGAAAAAKARAGTRTSAAPGDDDDDDDKRSGNRDASSSMRASSGSTSSSSGPNTSGGGDGDDGEGGESDDGESGESGDGDDGESGEGEDGEDGDDD